jgi:ribosomal protein S18 acetylase RimI-like enzyme
MERPAPPDVHIRLAESDECSELLEIERRSSHRFADVPGLTGWVDDITPAEVVEAAFADGLVWVAETSDAHQLVGWCFASVLDDSLFIEQIDVLPEHGRRGIGQALIDDVQREAEARGLTALTLTTDAHVEWNRPWYEKLGFRALAPGELGPGLASAVADEVRRGFDLSRRVAMRREIGR